jgi:cytoskeleton protein RodZ
VNRTESESGVQWQGFGPESTRISLANRVEFRFSVRRERETGLPSFGEKLKKEREKRKISLEQISLSTKIGTRMLQALEEDKFNQLPGGIFNKGFVRAYARCVGLDEDQTVAEYLQASGDAPPVSTEIATREGDTRNPSARERAERTGRVEVVPETPSRPLPWGAFAAALLAIALALSFWSHRRQQLAKQPDGGASTITMPTSGGSAGGAPGTPPNQTSAAPATEPGSAATSGDANPAPASASPASQNGASRTGAEFTVVIQSREESWVTITADGQKLPAELLKAGGERTIRGRKQITVKAGNAGGVDFVFKPFAAIQLPLNEISPQPFQFHCLRAVISDTVLGKLKPNPKLSRAWEKPLGFCRPALIGREAEVTLRRYQIASNQSFSIYLGVGNRGTSR